MNIFILAKDLKSQTDCTILDRKLAARAFEFARVQRDLEIARDAGKYLLRLVCANFLSTEEIVSELRSAGYKVTHSIKTSSPYGDSPEMYIIEWSKVK